MPTGLPAFVEDLPHYEVRSGRMHVTMGAFDLVMPINVFLDGCEAGKAAIVEWQKEQLHLNNVVWLNPPG